MGERLKETIDTFSIEQKHHAFLLKLSDAIRPLINPVDIEEAVTKIAMEFMDADWCHYATIKEDKLIILHDAVRGDLPTLAGVYPISSFALFKAVLNSGLPFIVEDVHTTNLLDEELKQLCMQLQSISFIIVPVIKNSMPVGLLSLVQSKPRKWTNLEVQLTIETSERTWAAVERATAEEALRKSEEKYRTLFNSMDEGFCTLRVLFDDVGKAIDCLYLEVNTAFIPQSGLENVVGKTMLEVNPETEEFWIETYGRISRTGKAERFEHIVSGLQKFYEFYAFRFGEPGENRVAVIFNNITDRKNEEEKQTYILKLSDAIKELIDPVEIQLTACRILGEHVKVNRVLYGEVIDEEQIIINNNYVNGVPPINATFDAVQFGRNRIDAFKRNEKVIISDITTDPGYSEEEKQSFLSLDVVANVGMGLVKGGRWVATFGMHYNAPRKWTATEIWLLEETAGRTWAAVERAKAEQALRKSEEKYRTLFTSIDQGYVFCELVRNKEGKGIDYYMLELNPTYEKQTGLSIEMVLGKTILQVFPTMDMSHIDTFAAVVDNQCPVAFEQYFDANNRWHEVKVYPGEKDKFTVLFSDISERKQAEEKIKESESLFRSMADAAPVLIWTIDANGFSSYYNKTFLDFIGASKDEDISDWGRIVHPDDIQLTLNSINTAIAERRSYSLECRLLRADGQWRWVLAQGNPRMGANNEFLGFVGSSVDITERREAEEKIKESERKFGAAIHAVEGIIWTNNAIGEMEGEQPGWAKLTGQSLEEYQGYGWSSAVHPDDAQLTVDAWNIAVKNKSIFEYEHRLKTKQYGWRHFSVKAVPTFYENNEIQQWIGVHTDITKQREAANKIKESEERFRSLADKSPIIVYIVEPDAAANMSYFNETWLKYTGQSFEESLGRAWDGIVHPDDLKEVFDIYIPAFEAAQAYTLPAVRLKRYDGEYRWHLFKGNPRHLSTGEFDGFIGVGFDIHEQKLAQQKTKESEERFRLLSNEMPQFVWTGDAYGYLGYFNEAVYNYSGLSKEKVVDEGWLQIVHPEEQEENIRLWQLSIATGEDFIFEHRFKKWDGEYRWQLSRAVAQRDAQGTIQQWIGTSTDIQDQKNVEEQLEKLVAERTKELQRSNEDLQQFAHVASHDLREPVRKIKVFTDRLEQQLGSNLDETSKRFIDKIHMSTYRMFTMIDGVLAYSTTNANLHKLELVDLTEVIKSIEIDLEVGLQEKNATLIYNNLPSIFGAPILVYQLFYNLINNSIKFAKNEVPPCIVIASEVIVNDNKSFIRITVQDNGIGFEPEMADQLFEIFTRLHPKDKFEGTGLGLSLCKKIAERHGGSIIANGALNKGATFIISLPLNQNLVSI